MNGNEVHNPEFIDIRLQRRTSGQIIEILTGESHLLRAENFNLRHENQSLKEMNRNCREQLTQNTELIAEQTEMIKKLKEQIPKRKFQVYISGREDVPYCVSVNHYGSGTVIRGGFFTVKEALKWCDDYNFEVKPR